MRQTSSVQAARTVLWLTKHGEFVDYDIEEALAMQKEIPEYHYQVSKALAT